MHSKAVLSQHHLAPTPNGCHLNPELHPFLQECQCKLQQRHAGWPAASHEQPPCCFVMLSLPTLQEPPLPSVRGGPLPGCCAGHDGVRRSCGRPHGGHPRRGLRSAAAGKHQQRWRLHRWAPAWYLAAAGGLRVLPGQHCRCLPHPAQRVLVMSCTLVFLPSLLPSSDPSNEACAHFCLQLSRAVLLLDPAHLPTCCPVCALPPPPPHTAWLQVQAMCAQQQPQPSRSWPATPSGPRGMPA